MGRGRGKGGHGDTWGDGRGNLRVAKTPPLQSGVAGRLSRSALRSKCHPLRLRHAHTIQGLCKTNGKFFITIRRRKGGHSGVGGQLSACLYSISPTKSAIANLDNW